jgi:hypothetical protein
MKILVLGLHRTAPGPLLGDEHLACVRHLMGAGVYGVLDGDRPLSWSCLIAGLEAGGHAPGAAVAPTLSDWFDQAGRRALTVVDPGFAGASRRFHDVRSALGRDDWDFLLAIADGPDQPDDYPDFDDELGGLLEILPDDAAILIVSTLGAFLLAGPDIPAVGEILGVRPVDLAPTLLTLAGLQVPSHLTGRPIAIGAAPVVESADDADVLERLRGLGYI